MNIRKKLLGYLAIIGLGMCVFAPSMGNIAHAETSETTQETVNVEQALNELWTLIDIGLKLVYIVIWPMLFLAGIALDNSMVYGSFFHMDAPLWFFWNMMKNFANFALGFIVLFAILKGIFSSFGDKGKDARNPMEIIKKTLIAGVLIQASWFLMAAVIDVSTIATYAVGGMPMTLLKEGNNKKIIQTESQLELNNINKLQEQDFKVWYKIQVENNNEPPVEISPCLLKTLGTDTYIVGRKYGDAKFSAKEIDNKITSGDLKIFDTSKFPTRNVCIFGDTPYFFNEFPNTWNANEEEYSSILARNLNEIGNNTNELEDCNFIINLDKSKDTSNDDADINCDLALTDIETYIEIVNEGTTGYQKYNEIFIEGLLPTDSTKENYGSIAGTSRLSSTLAPTVSEIIDKTQGFVGPFVTIYASIMDFANLSDSDSPNSSIGKNLGSMIIRTAVAAGLVFPLIALAVVLFIRIGFLWAVIAASPILILANVFKDSLKIDLGKHFTIENILKAIFAPVITVFALSISMIFMTTLSNSLSPNSVNKATVMEQLGGTMVEADGTTSLTIAGFTIEYPKVVDTYAGSTGDWFSWMLLSFCGIGIMRFILFAAIKASGTIGSVGEKIKDFGENVFKSAPIIPIGGGMSMQGLEYAKTIPDQLTTQWKNEQTSDAGEFFESKFGGTLKGLDEGSLDTNGLNKYESENLVNILDKGGNIGEYLQRQQFVKENATEQDISTFLNTKETITALNEHLKTIEPKKAEEIRTKLENNNSSLKIDLKRYENEDLDKKSINDALETSLKGEENPNKKDIEDALKEIREPKSTTLSIEKTYGDKTYTITTDGGKIAVKENPK